MRRLIVVPLLLISFAAGAADVESHSKIASVTIFPNSALIGRLADVDLPAGPSRIIFKNLPIALDPASIQVSGRAASGLVIGAVTVHREVPEIKPDTEMDARLKELQKQRAAVQITLDALSVKKSMIIKFSAAGPEKIGPEARPLDVADWTKAWDEVQGGLVSTGKEFELQQTQAHELDDKIAGIIAAQPGPNTKSYQSA